MKETMPETVCLRLDRTARCTYPRCDCPVSFAPADEHIAAEDHFKEPSVEFMLKAIIEICNTRGYTHQQDKDAIRATARMGLRLLTEGKIK
jgi:hypothetical protein